MPNDDRLSSVTHELREIAKAGLHIDSGTMRLRLLERSPILSGLPALEAAGSDTGFRFVYLTQAIVDAVDDLAGDGTLKRDARHASPVEAAALRALFGLVERTRRTSWRARQEAAALALHVSWDHFRHSRQDPLLRVLGEHMLAESAKRSGDARGVNAPDGLVPYTSYIDVENAIVAYIERARPSVANMLEFSTATTRPILRALRDVGSHIRLLIANPDRVADGWQVSRIRATLAGLLGDEFSDYSSLELGVYSTPPALRGRSIGDLIAVGWYTYRDNKMLDACDPAATEVWGHDNAVIIGNSTEPSGAALANWFNREFDRLWEHRQTRGASAVTWLLDEPR